MRMYRSTLEAARVHILAVRSKLSRKALKLHVTMYNGESLPAKSNI